MQICIFEDNTTNNFEPLAFYRPVFELVIGINTLREKILRYYPGYTNSVICRDYLAEFLTEQIDTTVNNIADDDYLFINGRLLADESLPELIPAEKNNTVYVQGDTLVAAKVSAGKLKYVNLDNPLSVSSFDGFPVEEVKVTLLSYVFDSFKYLNKELIKDFNFYTRNNQNKSLKNFNGVHLIEPENIFIEEGAVVKPGVVIDASGGPVLIGRNAVIFPNSVIEGPVYIGESSLIKSCSTIYQNVSIGRVCKVGGEVEDMIMLDYSNKQHAGFIGHAYLGSWVNLGADTNCSDLKNNYSTVRVTLGSKEVDSGLQFLGLLMGDHSKTAINTMFNTGTMAGFSCNIYGAGFPDKYIPSFSWGGSDGLTEYNIDKSILTAAKVLARRKKSFTPAEDKLFRKIFDQTRNDRVRGSTANV